MKGNNNAMPRLCGFTISLILTCVIVCVTWNSGVKYAGVICGLSAITSFLWLVSLIYATGWKEYRPCEIVVSIILFSCIALFMCDMWHQGYITNLPIIGINSVPGTIYRDTLYHSAIASGIAYYGYPTLLVNSSVFHSYHFASHVVFAAISRILKIPTIYTYCYIYPILFFPLFSSLILAVAVKIRKVLMKIQKITIWDVVVLAFFSTFLLIPRQWAESLVVWTRSWFLSESYCMSLIWVMLGIYVYFGCIERHYFDRKWFASFFYWVVVPLFIIVTSLFKISVGFVFTVVLGYYAIRRTKINVKIILRMFVYVVSFALVYFGPDQFYSPIASGNSADFLGDIDLMSFAKDYVANPNLYGLHFLAYFAFALVFVVYRLKNVCNISEIAIGIRSKKYIIEEILLVACVVGYLPGFFFHIEGGSSGYFSSIQQLMGAVLIIGYNIPDEFISMMRKCIRHRLVIKVFSIFVILCLTWNIAHDSFLSIKHILEDYKMRDVQRTESDRQDGCYAIVDRINEITQTNKSDYYIFIDESATIWDKYNNDDSCIFFYPAMTGVVCIGELYINEHGSVCTNRGNEKGGFYIFTPKEECKRLNYDTAYLKAKQDGKKAIFYIHDDTMDIIDIK